MYQSVYKCRLCGEVFGHFTFSKAQAQEVLNENCHNAWEEHKCSDGSIGFADFQGFKKVGEP